MVFLKVTNWGEFYIAMIQGTCFWLTSTFLEQLALSASESREKKQVNRKKQMFSVEENTRGLNHCKGK